MVVPSGDVSFSVDLSASGDSGSTRWIYDAAVTGNHIDGYIENSNRIVSRHGSTTNHLTGPGGYSRSFNLTSVFDNRANILHGYIDGDNALSAGAGDLAPVDAGGILAIGRLFTGNLQLNGHIKRFTIYDEALTALEVSLL